MIEKIVIDKEFVYLKTLELKLRKLNVTPFNRHSMFLFWETIPSILAYSNNTSYRKKYEVYNQENAL